MRPPRRFDGELLACSAIIAVAALGVALWLAGGLAAVVTGHTWPALRVEDALSLVPGVLRHLSSPARAWPIAARPDLPGAPLFYASVAGVMTATLAILSALRRIGRRIGAPPASRAAVSGAGAAWATSREIRPLCIARPGGGRLAVGRSGRRLVAIERGHSVLVVGPTQSGKTTGLAIPALLEWDGPVIATSVKTDLVRDTHDSRSARGEVAVFDPTGISGLTPTRWSPLDAASTWSGARRVASGLCGVARGGSGLEDGAFWYQTAEKLLAPLLFAAAQSGGTIADVVRWVDTGEIDEVLGHLDRAGVADAVRAAEASFSRDERQRSSVYTTAETVLAPFADPVVASSCSVAELDPKTFLAGGAGTLFLVAPSHEQTRLQSVFVAIITAVLEVAVEHAARTGRPLEPPMLVVLDEAANIAPLAALDTLASTAASHGVQLLTIWQDFAQIEARYGARAATVVNNHRAKVLCSGITDPSTLELASRLIGDEERTVATSTSDGGGSWSRSETTSPRRLAPAEALRGIGPGHAVLLYGHFPPVPITLRGPSAPRRAGRIAQRRST